MVRTMRVLVMPVIGLGAELIEVRLVQLAPILKEQPIYRFLRPAAGVLLDSCSPMGIYIGDGLLLHENGKIEQGFS